MKIENLDQNAVMKIRITDRCNFHCPYCIRRDFINKRDYDWNIKEWLRIAYDMYCVTGKKVKIDLIGGEITVLPEIQQIVDALEKEVYIEKINITTNLELDPPLGHKLSCTASYHPTQTKYDIYNWFLRAKEWSKRFVNFKVETVRLYESNHIDKFIELANHFNLQYMVEENLLDPRLKGKDCYSNKKNFRYKVTFDDGTEKYYKTRNSYLKENGFPNTEGLYCSNGYDYVYIEGDKVLLCGTVTDIKDFNVMTKMHKCFNEGVNCSLCGNISVMHKSSLSSHNNIIRNEN